MLKKAKMCVEVNIDLEIGKKLTLKKLDAYLFDLTKDKALNRFSAKDVLFLENIVYRISKECVVSVSFNVIKENKEDPFESMLKITYIDLSYLPSVKGNGWIDFEKTENNEVIAYTRFPRVMFNDV